MKTYVEYPPRKLQSEVYTGPITHLELSEVPVGARAVRQGRHKPPAADRKLGSQGKSMPLRGTEGAN